MSCKITAGTNRRHLALSINGGTLNGLVYKSLSRGQLMGWTAVKEV
jgi:hypothetical protein